MKHKLHLLYFLLVTVLFSNSINAADFVDVTLNPKVSSGTLNLDGANGPVVVNFEGSSIIDKVLFTKSLNSEKTVLASQDPVAIQNEIEQQFKLSGLVLTAAGDINGDSPILSSTKPLNFIAIHFGKHELFIKFAMPTTNFNFSVKGKAAGLSNYRAYYLAGSDGVITFD